MRGSLGTVLREIEAAPAPAWLINALSARKQAPCSDHAHDRVFGGDRKRILERASKYVAKIPPAVSGQRGHDQTFAAACSLVQGFALSVDEALPILTNYSQRCVPPWTEEELLHKLHDAEKQPGDRGRLLHDALSKWRSKQAQSNGNVSTNGVPATDPLKYHRTDEGNAQRVVDRHGKDLRYCHSMKQWFVFDGQRWAEDETAEAVRRVKETQAALYCWVVKELAAMTKEDAAGDQDKERASKMELTRLIKHCLDWEDARDISRTLQLAASEPTIPIVPAQLDADQFLLNCLNGTLDLRSGKLREHRRGDYLTKLCPVEYQPDAICPRWDAYLQRVQNDDADMIGYLQRVVGYSLTADVREQALWFLYGLGANGKSVFLTTILAMLGDYAIQAISDLLLSKKNESHPTERADLFGRRFVATTEVDNGRHMAEALMKQLTGGEKVRARKMFKDFFEFQPTWKIFLAANHKPVIRGTDHAAWRRIKLVPFTVTIPPEEQDKTLPQKLLAELPGILAWAVRGCLEWQRNGLAEPEDVRAATDAYRAEQDSLAMFINAYCVVGAHARVQASAIHDAYERWSGDKVSAKMFTAMMEAKEYPSRRGHGGYAFYHGIGLPAPSDDGPG
jgi:putative DNA primase/helicase